MVLTPFGYCLPAELAPFDGIETDELETPDIDLFSWDMWHLLLEGLLTTVTIFIFATIEAFLLSSLLTYFAISGKYQRIYKPLCWFVTTIRDIPAVALMMFFYYVLFRGELNGIIVTIIAAGFYTTGVIQDIFTRHIKEVSPGQIEAGQALGMTTRQCYRYIVLPQAVKTMLPWVIGQIKVQLRITSYAGYVSQTDLIRAIFNVKDIYSDMHIPLLIASLFYLIISKSIARGTTFLAVKIFKYD